jgi:nucleoid DNA-binding protein
MQIKRGGTMAAGVVFLLGITGIVFSQRPVAAPPTAESRLARDVAAKAKLPVKTVQSVLDALVPEILARIEHGDTVELPKLGRIRLVRVAEHKDMEKGTGRVINVPGRNFVTLDIETEVEKAVNANGVVPSEVIREFQYNILPGQTPALQTESLKVRPLRTPNKGRLIGGQVD